jgi:hypothetical protein
LFSQPFTNSRFHFLINSGIGHVSQVSLHRPKCIPGCFEWQVKWLTHVLSPLKRLMTFWNLCQGGTKAWGLCREIMTRPGISEWHGALYWLEHLIFMTWEIFLSARDMIYLLTAIGLPPGGSSTVHIYTHKQYTEWHKTNNIYK